MTENQPNNTTPANNASSGEGCSSCESYFDDDRLLQSTGVSVRPRWLNVCNDRLLPDPLITTVTATRFIRPIIKINGQETSGDQPRRWVERSVVPRTVIDPTAAIRQVAGMPGATWLDAQGGVSLIPDWNHPDLHAPAIETVPLGDVVELIATQQLPDTGLSLRLEPGDVAALTNGQPTLVALPISPASYDRDTQTPERELPPSKVRDAIALRDRLRTGRTMRTSREERSSAPETSEMQPLSRYVWLMPPAPSQLKVTNLPAFLADPRTPGGIPLQLASSNVEELLTEGHSEVRVAGLAEGDNNALVSVVVEASPPAPEPTELLSSSEALSTSGSSTPTVQLAIALRWRQRWKLKGYTRGALLSTISLAPQEQTTIEIFTWDRRRTESDRTSSFEMNSNLDTSDTVRDTTDVLNETKKTSNLNWSVQAGLTIPIATGVPLTLGGSAQDHQTMDGLHRETTNHVHEAVTKSATSVRLSRETKVNETTEVGSERRVTRAVTNQNLCHVLNLDYFEVLSKYQVKTTFDRAATRICALVPSPLTPSFTRLTARTYESTLRANLLERDLLDGFDAIRMLAAKDNACAVACERCTCGTASTEAGPLPAYAVTAMTTVGSAWYTLQTAQIPPNFPQNRAWYDAWRRIVYRVVVEVLTPEIANNAWTMLTATIGIQKRPLTREDADRLWWAVKNAGGVDAIRPSKLVAERQQLIDDLCYDLFKIGVGGFTSKVPAISLSQLRGVLDDVGLTAALDRFMASFDAAPAATASSAASTSADSGQAARESAIRDAFPLRATTDALEREEALLAHLSNNASHYWYALWQATAPTQQAAFLDGLLPPGIIEPSPIGMIDHCLAFPISASTVPSVEDVIDGLFGAQDSPFVRAEEITLPTTAVTMEARLGTCDACEDFIHESRKIDLRSQSAAADQAQAEADRRRARLNKTPPDLDPYEPPAAVPRLDVRIEQAAPPVNP
jgi:hypothetical protein